LVEFVVGSVAGRVAEGGAVGERVVERGRERDDIGVGGAAVGVAEEGARIGGERFALAAGFWRKSSSSFRDASQENRDGSSKQAVHISIKSLLERGFITKHKDRVFVYKPNKTRIAELETRYIQKLSLK
jgi:hypothetical protein